MITGSIPIAFEPTDEQIVSLWIHACRLQMYAEALVEQNTDTWRETADAWAEVAYACPQNARMDLAVFWNMAGAAARRAKDSR